MRVLLVCPDAALSFWSMRTVCTLRSKSVALPPLGLLTVAALLPKEWPLRLVDLNVRALTEDDWAWADAVFVSGMLAHQEGLRAVTAEARRRGKRTVAGGPYPASLPESVLAAGADIVVRGEGEVTVPLVLKALHENRHGLVIESDERPEMTSSPVPRFDLLELDKYVGVGIQTSRGCPFDCEFCDIVQFYGRVPRYKTPDQVLAELEELYRLGWRELVFVSDDNFIGNRAHARALLEKLIPWSKQHGEPFYFWTQVSIDLGRDKELIDLMTAANFSTVLIGLESPDAEVLELNGKYQNMRDPMVESVNNITRNGLGVVGSFVVGFDGEKKGVSDRICALADATAMPLVSLSTLHVGPGTRLWKRLEKEGRLRPDFTSGQTTGGRLNYVPSRPEAEILDEYIALWRRLYDRTNYLSRAYQYYRMMRPTRWAMARARGEAGAPEDRPVSRSTQSWYQQIILLLRIAGWQGWHPRRVWQFWRQLFGMCRHNPSRMIAYMNTCALGESIIRLTDEIVERTAAGRMVPS